MGLLIPALILAIAMLAVEMACIASLPVTALIASMLMDGIDTLSEQEARDVVNRDIYIAIASAFGIDTAMVNSGVVSANAGFLVDVGGEGIVLEVCPIVPTCQVRGGAILAERNAIVLPCYPVFFSVDVQNTDLMVYNPGGYKCCAISLDANTQYHNSTMSNPSHSGIPSWRRSQRWSITWIMLLSLQALLLQGVHVAPRHCRGGVKHLHLSVGKDPSTQMTISFASTWSDPGVEAPIAGVHIGTAPNHLDRFVGEHEFPVTYVSGMLDNAGHHYYSPFQHHITIDNLEPNTTYYYIAVLGDRSLGIDYLRDLPLKDHPSQHQNLDAENKVMNAQQQVNRDNDEGSLRRRLAPPPYDGHEKPCVEGFQVRSFTTAPRSGSEAAKSATFAIIGDLGQFDHSKETLAHMKANRAGIDAVVLVGDIAYTDYDHRRWDTFFDFLDDYSIFDEVPLQVAIGNHDIDKQENGNELFQAYETRFRMPQVYPPEIGVFDGPAGLLNMDAPPYPLPYEWGNAYYVFDYGPAKHIVLSAYSNMNPGSKQYIWFLSVLQTVDRNITPWVLVTIHVPIYNTFSLHPHDLQIFAAKEHLEPLFVQYHVNVVFTGHIHAYLRTVNVAMDEPTETGPLHITIGAGGRQCDAPFKSEEPEPWVVTRDATVYGYGRFQIFNATHAEWRWIHLSYSDSHDYNRVKGNDEVHLPQLEHDEHVLENQYFLAQGRL